MRCGEGLLVAFSWAACGFLGLGVSTYGIISIANQRPAGTCKADGAQYSCERLVGKEDKIGWRPVVTGVSFDGNPDLCRRYDMFVEKSEKKCQETGAKFAAQGEDDCILYEDEGYCRTQSLCNEDGRRKNTTIAGIMICFGVIACIWGTFASGSKVYKHATTKDSQSDEVPGDMYGASCHTATFQPGTIGADIDEASGRVCRVHEGGQLALAGVAVGIVIAQIDGKEFTLELLLKYAAAEAEYTISFKDEPLAPEVTSEFVLQEEHKPSEEGDVSTTASTMSNV